MCVYVYVVSVGLSVYCHGVHACVSICHMLCVCVCVSVCLYDIVCVGIRGGGIEGERERWGTILVVHTV